jgi:hypothetical protein
LGKARGQIIFADALYFKSLPSTMTMLDTIADGEKKKAKVLKIFAICALYGYLDYAMEIFESTKQTFQTAERIAILHWLRKSKGWYARIPVFPGRAQLSRLFYHISELLKPTHSGWAAIERQLGNK